jgi:hypothetical protein
MQLCQAHGAASSSTWEFEAMKPNQSKAHVNVQKMPKDSQSSHLWQNL